MRCVAGKAPEALDYRMLPIAAKVPSESHTVPVKSENDVFLLCLRFLRLSECACRKYLSSIDLSRVNLSLHILFQITCRSQKTTGCMHVAVDFGQRDPDHALRLRSIRKGEPFRIRFGTI